MNRLYFGDNLAVLREHVKDESVDLVYLDPPFNSKRDYNLLFKSPKGEASDAQITAFEDTWHWGIQAEEEFAELLTQPNTNVAELMRVLRSFLGENDMMAYLTMMANRLLELHRALKETGSIYLHCDPTASHYLKIVLDAVFGKERFKSEIIWRRTGAHNKATRWGPIHDVIFFFTKSVKYCWNNPKLPYMVGHVRDNFAADGNGGWRTDYYGNVLTGSGTRNGESGAVWQGFNPTAKNRHWAIPGAIWDEVGVDPSELTQHQKLDLLLGRGFIKIEPGAAWPIYERAITEKDGPATSDIWSFQPYTEGTVFGTNDGIDADVSWIKPQDSERLGYPTQKPLGLLERIIQASSNEGDVVLDPFCGCGTAVHAAEKLKRRWIGIDITHLAISLIEKRMRDAFPALSNSTGMGKAALAAADKLEAANKIAEPESIYGSRYEVIGTPKDLASARELALRDKYQFQWWACSLVNAQPFQGKKKGADGGIDGLIYFQDDASGTKKIVVSVKGGDNVNAAMVRDLKGVMEREKAALALFVTLADASKPMEKEAASAGFYECATQGNRKYARLQVLTIADLLAGHARAEYPDLALGAHTFKKAKKEQGDAKQSGLF